MKRLPYLAIAAAVLLFSYGASCGGGHHSPPVPTPTPPPPPSQVPEKGVPVLLELGLRTSGTHLTRGIGGEPVVPFVPNGYEQCCAATPEIEGCTNSRWPSISICLMNWAAQKSGANYFAIRVAPYLADNEHEIEWADIGGPVLPGQWPNFNQPWWDEHRKIIWHAGKVLGANVQVAWDAWYGKTCKNGSQPCAWPSEEIRAWGETFTPGHQRFIDKIVEEFGCFGNVTWLTDIEGAQVPRAQRTYYEAVARGFRDAEQRLGCGIVHLIGTNWPEIGNSAVFDYVTTHSEAALTTTFHGKHTANDEHNFTYSAEEDHSRYCDAQSRGLHYWFWNGPVSADVQSRSLELRRSGCGGGVECFAPGASDPLWDPNPTGGGSKELLWPINSAKLEVGEHCGTDHQGSLDTIGLLAAELRKRGYCASGPWGDALAIRAPNGLWQEFHSVSFLDGCWANNSAVLPKNTWTYNGPAHVPAACTVAVPGVDQIGCKLHQATNHVYDCTPRANGQPILPEGHPQRQVCELAAMGGASPTYFMSGIFLTLTPQRNPMQVSVKGSGTGTLTCKVPAQPHTLCNLTITQ